MEEGELARDSRWFDMARARRVLVFCGFCGDQCWRFFLTQKLGGAADVIGQGCRRCALALCDSAKLLPRPGLQPGGLRSPLVLSLITPSHVVLAFPFYFNDHSILLPLKTLHSHDPIGLFLSQRPSCDHINCPAPLTTLARTSSRQPLFAVHHHSSRHNTTPHHHPSVRSLPIGTPTTTASNICIQCRTPKSHPKGPSRPPKRYHYPAPAARFQPNPRHTDSPQAAAPQPPQIVTSTSASTSSLVDVDTPSVRTVPSDFGEQEVQTDTQAARLEREAEEAAARARAEADLAKKKARNKARKADTWLTKKFEELSDGSSGALVAANLIGLVGLSGWLGFKAWGLYDNGRLTWKSVGLGLGILGAVGAVEGVFGG